MKTWRVGRTSRRSLGIDKTEIADDGSLRIDDLAAVRRLAARLNASGEAPSASAGKYGLRMSGMISPSAKNRGPHRYQTAPMRIAVHTAMNACQGRAVSGDTSWRNAGE